jgi:hypothetical protein
MSATQSDTVETISRAATAGAGFLLFRLITGVASSFFITLIFVRSVMIASPLLIVPDNGRLENVIYPRKAGLSPKKLRRESSDTNSTGRPTIAKAKMSQNVLLGLPMM